MRPLLGPLVLGAVAIAAGAAPAHAYVRTTLKSGKPVTWASTCQTLQLYVGEPPAPLTADAFLMAARAAARAWGEPQTCSTDFAFTIMPVPASSAIVDNDGRNRVTFRRARWCKEPLEPGASCYDRSALAITSVMADRDTGRIFDADVEINAVDFQWADLVVNPTAEAHDIQNTLTHEFGHVIGLDHTCFGGSTTQPRGIDHLGNPIPDCRDATREVRDTTMFVSVSRGDLSRRDLTMDDELAVCGIYPGEGGMCRSTGVGSDDGGGCAVSAPGRARPLGALIAALASALTWASFRRRWRRRG